MNYATWNAPIRRMLNGHYQCAWWFYKQILATEVMSKYGLSLNEVLQLVQEENGDSAEEASGDEEELSGADYVHKDGRPMLLGDGTRGYSRDAHESEFFTVNMREDPCYRISSLLLDQSLALKIITLVSD